jgi:murein DD-endopeptidase MepM/ murein hydrolase activator NlpD
MNSRRASWLVLGCLVAAAGAAWGGLSALGGPGGRRAGWRERCPPAGSFDFPVGGGTASGYYDAQPFGANFHLGEDWNGVGGGDSDLGDPVLAIAAGVVRSTRDHGGGWGRVVRVVHDIGSPGAPRHVESLYAHLASIEVAAGDVVARGQRIGSIGKADGRYPAHLHLELRDRVDLPLGRGYGADASGYLDPTAFIGARRDIERESPRR